MDSYLSNKPEEKAPANEIRTEGGANAGAVPVVTEAGLVEFGSQAASDSTSETVPIDPMVLPTAAFRVKLSKVKKDNPEPELRWAIYDPFKAELVWEDTKEKLIAYANPKDETRFNFTPISKESPGLKNSALKVIKIQVGFGCNYTCGFCSKTSAPTTTEGEPDVSHLVQNLQTNYDGGQNGHGAGTRVDFTGGHTLLQWRQIKTIAKQLKTRYPEIRFTLNIDGSMILEELIDEALRLDMTVILNHDGVDQKKNRGHDPFETPEKMDFLKRLAGKLIPKNLFLVQMTLGKANFALTENRAFIAEALRQPHAGLPLTFEITQAFDQSAIDLIPASFEEVMEFQKRVLKELRGLSWTQAMSYANFRLDLLGLVDPLLGRTNMANAYQRCEMDKPTSLAIDLNGNVLTCQNTTAEKGHKIGDLDKLPEVKLNTSHHWSSRMGCRSCPVVSMCKGACMHLGDEQFLDTCNSLFPYYLSLLIYIIEHFTGYKILELEGDNIRASGVNKFTIA